MEFVRFLAKDGVELQGLYQEGKKDKIVLHIHGWCGNFYENRFVQAVGNELQKLKIAYLAFNNRGHEMRTGLVKFDGDKKSFLVGGGAVDKFNDCVEDIAGAIDFCKKLGYKKIILQGHSTGAQKVMLYVLKNEVYGTILLSPGDIYSEISVGNKNFQSVYKKALEKIKSGKGSEILSESLWGVNFSAEALVNCFGLNVPADMFPIRDNKNNELIENFKGKLLVVVGKQDALLNSYTTGEKGFEYFKKCFKNADAEFCMLDDDHSFNNNTEDFARVVAGWVNKI